ncbi:LysR family transcriptional regulator [Variovorax sp. Sphag1AA]|uniref:LysR family transcriptional regulator n=1 Tax=Variovorax sp. Sphag1AA TaxID=2587027 RepID=UPI001621ABBD|nr:LysR family transcriptional regulator [Variovorax sp. Sphag1AA]MBB3180456.1 DNA-binding transcriptional LysR family regulator [Variovorax sp. Sphag1AA]
MALDLATSPEIRRLVGRLRFRHLQLLMELQRGGSLRAAASVLNLTQPALSKALGEVESAFGFPLFTRSARGLAPTPRGEIAIRGAVLLLEELAHLGAEASAEPAVTVLRVGAPPFVAQGYLPEVFSRLLGEASRVRVQLQEERVPLLVHSLTEGRLDALITSYPTEMPEAAGRSLHYEKLFDAGFAVIAPPGHLLGRARRVDWQRLAREQWIMPAPTSMVRRMMEEVFRREGLIAPVPVIESTSPVTNVRLVAAGLGLSAVPESTLRSTQGTHPVARVRVHPAIPPGPVALIHRAGPDNPRLALLRGALGLR